MSYLFFLYNQTPLPAGSNPKDMQRNEIWQVDVFYFVEFGKIKYVHHTIDTYSGFQWATVLSSEKVDSVITYLLKVMATIDAKYTSQFSRAAIYRKVKSNSKGYVK